MLSRTALLNADSRRRRTQICHTRLLSNDAHVLLRMAVRWKGDLVVLRFIDDVFAIQCSGELSGQLDVSGHDDLVPRGAAQ